MAGFFAGCLSDSSPIAVVTLINVPSIQNVKTISPICLFNVPICPRRKLGFFGMSWIKATAKWWWGRGGGDGADYIYNYLLLKCQQKGLLKINFPPKASLAGR